MGEGLLFDTGTGIKQIQFQAREIIVALSFVMQAFQFLCNIGK